jgi:SecD/SecF fusion protein
MAANYATFSLPGIAGAILCIAMAVDANVLIFERMREESLQGADLKKSVRLGYDKAMSAIVDGNLTNLIHCLVLGFVGTPEIRGFAITMGMGVLTTLFAQLVVTKLIFDAGIEYLGWRKAPMLPLAIPAVQRAFTLSVDWMKYRKVFYAVFGTLVVLSALIIARQGSKMLDTEFVGGTALTLRLKDDANGNPTLLSRAEVQERLIRIADANPRFAELRTADILVLNPDDTTYKSNNFTIKTIIQSETGGSGDVGAAIVHEFADLVDARPALSFTSAEIPDAARAPVFTIVNPRLGANIDRPALTRNVPEFLGGAAIVLNNIQPPTPVAVLKARIDDARSKPEFSSTIGRPMEIAVLDGTDEAVKSAVVLVRDPDHSFFGSSSWNTVVRDREWRLVQTALANEGDLISVQKFDSAVASDFVASAIAAMVLSSLLIVVYVWVRFNSIRYSLAALIPTLIDCFIVTGLVAGAEVLFELAPEFATNLLIFPFKIDLVAVASILTILGYSINDKIVVLDRIRENRGKLTFASREIINESINQTMSRTLMTGTTTILATLILYLVGGEAIRGFAYTLGLGVIIGTASSVALGAPMVWAKTSEVEEPADGSEPATV